MWVRERVHSSGSECVILQSRGVRSLDDRVLREQVTDHHTLCKIMLTGHQRLLLVSGVDELEKGSSFRSS